MIVLEIVLGYGIYVLVVAGAIALLAGLILMRGALGHPDPEPPAWVNQGTAAYQCDLCEFERQIRTPGLLERALVEELGA